MNQRSFKITISPEKVLCQAPNATGFHEPITEEACLQCALKNKMPPCGFDYTLLKYIYSHKRYRALDIHVSDVLSCPKRAWFEKKIEYPATAATRLIVTLGTLQHALLEEMEDAEYVAETIVEGYGGDLVGTVDAYYHDGRIVDYKTTRNINLRYVPQKKHEQQVNVYKRLLEQMGKEVTSAYIQYIDFLGPSKCPTCKSFVTPSLDSDDLICPLCKVPVDGSHLGAVMVEVPLWPIEEADEYIQSRVDYLSETLKGDTPPEHTEPDFLCRYCPFLSLCADGRAEVTRTR